MIVPSLSRPGFWQKISDCPLPRLVPTFDRLSRLILSRDNEKTSVPLSRKVALSHPVGNPSLNLFGKAGNRNQDLTFLIYLHGHDHRYFALALHDDAFKVAKSLFVIITLQLIFKANYFFMVSRQAVLKLYLHKILWPRISKWKIFFWDLAAFKLWTFYNHRSSFFFFSWHMNIH